MTRLFRAFGDILFRVVAASVWFLVFLYAGYNVAYAGFPVSLTVKELNGVESKDTFIRRGIPFDRGELESVENLQLVDENGHIIPLQAEMMQTYEDGSIKWVSIAFLADLTQDAERLLKLCRQQPKYKHDTDLEVSVSGEAVVLKNSTVELGIRKDGSSTISYSGKLVGTSTLFVSPTAGKNDRVMFVGKEVEVISSGPVYACVRLRGEFAPLDVEAEWYLTLLSGSSRVLSEIRFVSKTDISLKTTAQVMTFTDNYTQVSHDKTHRTRSTGIPFFSPSLVASRWFRAYNPQENTSVVFMTEDIHKFFGAVAQDKGGTAVTNGFVYRKVTGGRELVFAPIQYDMSWMWLDGVSRTVHLQMSFCEGILDDETIDSGCKSLYDPPAVIIDPQQFISSGVLDSVVVSPSVQRAIGYVKSVKDKRWGYFEAGSLPYWIEREAFGSIEVSGFDVRPGETAYNLWHAQMMTGDPVLFQMINDDAESWADVQVYRGGLDYLEGANRYRTGSHYGKQRFFLSHPYYGDPSGMYLSYLMTGNPYYRETFKTMVDYIVQISCDFNNMGYHIPRMFNWGRGSPEFLNYVESRYMIQARPLIFAFNLFKDDTYREIAIQIARWAEDAQHETGFWYQAYYDDGSLLYQSDQSNPPVKNYIMLYGVRGLCALYEETKEKWIMDTLVRFGDYILDELQPDGWLWDPTDSKTLYATNEDGARGNAPYQEIMAIGVLDTIYRATNNIKYLDGMLKMLRYYLGSQLPGGGSVQRYNAKGYQNGTIGGPNLGNNIAYFLCIAPRINKTLEENEELIEGLGYRDLLAVFAVNAQEVDRRTIRTGYTSPEFTINAFDTFIGRVIYMVNHSAYQSGVWTKEINAQVDTQSIVYSGMTNLISPGETRIIGRMEQFEMACIVEIPVRIVGQNSDLKVEVLEYGENMLVLALQGKGKITVEIYDGYFKVTEDEVYSLNDGESRRLLEPDGAVLQFDVDLCNEQEITRIECRNVN